MIWAASGSPASRKPYPTDVLFFEPADSQERTSRMLITDEPEFTTVKDSGNGGSTEGAFHRKAPREIYFYRASGKIRP
jgi:hypothetical protein